MEALHWIILLAQHFRTCLRGGESSAWTAAEEKLFLEGLNLYGM